MTMQPRFLSTKDAMKYLAMNPNEFYRDAQKFLTVIVRGTQKRVYDRLELEALADKIKAANGRPAQQEVTPWDENDRPACKIGRASGISTRLSTADDLAAVLEKVRSKEQ